MKKFKLKIDVHLPYEQCNELYHYIRAWESVSFSSLVDCIEFSAKCEGVIGSVFNDFYTVRVRFSRQCNLYTRECIEYGCNEPFAVISIVEDQLCKTENQ